MVNGWDIWLQSCKVDQLNAKENKKPFNLFCIDGNITHYNKFFTDRGKQVAAMLLAMSTLKWKQRH